MYIKKKKKESFSHFFFLVRTCLGKKLWNVLFVKLVVISCKTVDTVSSLYLSFKWIESTVTAS